MSIPSHEDADMIGRDIAVLAKKNPLYFSLGCILTFIFTYYIFKPLC